jgi:hypothetical protein
MTQQTCICVYRAKAGKRTALEELLDKHVATLQNEGLATSDQPIYSCAGNDTFVEIFVWKDERAGSRAHENPAVGAIWSQMAEVADFLPLSVLPEAQKPFSSFKRLG